jgi:hypothetical protein
LGDDCHLGLGVNGLSRAEEVLVAVAVVARLARTTSGVASAGAVGGARVGSEGS